MSKKEGEGGILAGTIFHSEEDEEQNSELFDDDGFTPPPRSLATLQNTFHRLLEEAKGEEKSPLIKGLLLLAEDALILAYSYVEKNENLSDELAQLRFELDCADSTDGLLALEDLDSIADGLLALEDLDSIADEDGP